jgi:hypothetical protein
MSASKDGRCIVCDNPECGAVSMLPVALRPPLNNASNALGLAAGWLFILKPQATLHFCPKCAPAHLASGAEDKANSCRR